jgi:hypothetical protein
MLINKIKDWLNHEVENTELSKEILCENNDDFIHFGRRECAEMLLEQIDKWQKEQEKNKTSFYSWWSK